MYGSFALGAEGPRGLETTCLAHPLVQRPDHLDSTTHHTRRPVHQGPHDIKSLCGFHACKFEGPQVGN